MPRDLDATDGSPWRSVHLYEMGTPTLGGKGGGWAAFVRENPGRTRVDQLAETSGVRSVWVGKAKSRPAALNHA